MKKKPAGSGRFICVGNEGEGGNGEDDSCMSSFIDRVDGGAPSSDQKVMIKVPLEAEHGWNRLG